MEITRIKTTGQIVHPIHKIDGSRTMVLFPFATKSNRGRLGMCQPVKNENLVTERGMGYAG